MHIKLKSLVTMQSPYNKRVGNVQTWCDSCASSSLARRLATKSRSRCHLSRRLLTWERISSLARCLLAISSSPTSYNSSHRGCRAFTSCSKAWHRHTGQQTNITSCLHCLLQSLTSAHRKRNKYYFMPSLPAPKPDIGTQVNKRILLHAFTSCSKAWHWHTGQQTNITSRLHLQLQSLTSAHRSTNKYYFAPSLPAPKPDIGTQVNKRILLCAFTSCSKG